MVITGDYERLLLVDLRRLASVPPWPKLTSEHAMTRIGRMRRPKGSN
jgi:hypothetical protein